MKKENTKQKILIALLLSTCYFLLTVSIASAGTIRKPPNNLGLAVYLTFDEGVGSQAGDYSGNGKNGTLQAGALSPTWINGKRGKALSFDGANDEVRYLVPSLTTTFTVAFWIYPKTRAGPAYQAIFASDCANGIYYHSGSGGNVRKINFYNNLGDALSTTQLTENQWNHVVVVDNAGSLTFYINGVPGGTATVSGTFAPNNTGNDSCNENFLGYLDDIRAYRGRALSATEVLALYQSGSAKINSSLPATIINKTRTPVGTLKNGLTGHWTFDGKDMISNVADVSGNGRHGFLTNFTSTTTAPGKLGQALTFDNTNDYVNTNTDTSNFISAGTGTISAWVRPAGNSPSSDYPYVLDNIIDKSSSWGFGIARGLWSGDDKIWVYNSDGVISYDKIGIPYDAGEWVHITWVHSGGVLYAYKNGELVGSTASGDTYAFAGNLILGSSWGGGGNWNGDIDDVRTWNRALTASEIKQVYNLGR